MTLGCGGYGGNITSDNISPRHLLNIKRLAWEVRPRGASRAVAVAAAGVSAPPPSASATSLPPLPRAPQPPTPEAVPADTVRAGLDRVLASRGAPPPPPARPEQGRVGPPADFICEDDVRRAAREGRTLLVGPRTILTPAARDAGGAFDVLVWLDGATR
jgi:hypothetical protein